LHFPPRLHSRKLQTFHPGSRDCCAPFFCGALRKVFSLHTPFCVLCSSFLTVDFRPLFFLTSDRAVFRRPSFSMSFPFFKVRSFLRSPAHFRVRPFISLALWSYLPETQESLQLRPPWDSSTLFPFKAVPGFPS